MTGNNPLTPHPLPLGERGRVRGALSFEIWI